MRILIAEDDPVSRRLLEATLVKWKYEAVVTVDGIEAWEVLQQEDAPELAILDWAMPGLDGVELCQRVRQAYDSRLTYIILLTARGGTENMVEGLGAGADDYVAKPFDTDELHARIQVGERILGLQTAFTDRLDQLEHALSKIKRLEGLLPICAACKKIRDDNGYWNQIETYIREHSEAEFSHSLCPLCLKQLYPEQYAVMFPNGPEHEP
jgi:CheY-like chemotaxis protein